MFFLVCRDLHARRHGRIVSAMESVIQELRLHRDAQLRRIEALETRAGIVLGFSGAIAAFSPYDEFFGMFGRAFAVLAAVLALGSFISRDFPLLDSRTLDSLIASDPDPYRHADLLARNIARARTRLRSKSRALAVSVISLVAATVTHGGVIIGTGGSL